MELDIPPKNRFTVTYAVLVLFMLFRESSEKRMPLIFKGK
jgi:hypothetical protein